MCSSDLKMVEASNNNKPASQAAADDSSRVFESSISRVFESSSNSSHDSSHPGPLPAKEKLGGLLLDLGGFVLALFAAAHKQQQKSVRMAVDLSPWKRLREAALTALQEATRHNLDQGPR